MQAKTIFGGVAIRPLSEDFEKLGLIPARKRNSVMSEATEEGLISSVCDFTMKGLSGKTRLLWKPEVIFAKGFLSVHVYVPEQKLVVEYDDEETDERKSRELVVTDMEVNISFNAENKQLFVVFPEDVFYTDEKQSYANFKVK